VEFLLESDNVIHSFWVPSLAGKMDLIPGRTNRLLLRPTRTGTFAGVCAEFCGRAHAKMRFTVIVVPPQEFDRWVTEQTATPVASAMP
jgi:cytochrome c oxidase subunit 2